MANDLAEKMWNTGVRVETMWWIGGLCDTPTSDFKDFVEDDLADEKHLLEAFPWLSELLDEEADAETIVGEFGFRRIDGFLVQLAHPIPRDFIESGGYSFSWGYYQTRWFYCKSLDEIVERAEKFAESVIEAGRTEWTRRKQEAARPVAT